MKTILGTAAVLAAGISLVSIAKAQEAPPVEAFAWLPTISGVSLSPSGDKFTSTVNLDEKYRFGVFQLVDGRMSPLYLTSETDRVSLYDSRWASDDRIVFSLYFDGQRYRQESQETRLMSMKPDGSDMIALFKFAENDYGTEVQIQNQIVSMLPDDPENILVQYGRYNRVYKVRVDKETRHKTYHPSRDDVGYWYADIHGTVMVGRGRAENGNRCLIVKLESGDWKDISHRVPEENSRFFIAGIPDDADKFYVIANEGGDTDALFLYDAATDELGEAIFRHPTSDVRYIVQDRDTGRALGVGYAEDDADVHWLEDSFIKDELEALKKVFSGKNVSISSINRNETHMVVFVDDAKDPGQYFIYDRQNRSIEGLPVQYPDLLDASLGDVVATSYQARDGLDIRAYVTLPPGMETLEEAQALPFVILPHGGPNWRDFLGFDYWAQFLASRGYGVLQMNFRGSTGYGTEFREAGEKQWGQAMQDDITDGANWLVAQGYADPQRLAIMGGSYGGYAALMGAVKTPDLYQCAVSFAGVADLPMLIKEEEKYVGGKYRTQYIGRLWGDRAMLSENSPMRRADEVQIPVLLVHGEKDFVVEVEQSREMEKRLRRNGKDVRYIELAGGDHYLSNYKNRLAFLQETDEFLKGCIGWPQLVGDTAQAPE